MAAAVCSVIGYLNHDGYEIAFISCGAGYGLAALNLLFHAATVNAALDDFIAAAYDRAFDARGKGFPEAWEKFIAIGGAASAATAAAYPAKIRCVRVTGCSVCSYERCRCHCLTRRPQERRGHH
jgi:hypothetical protein